MDGRSMRRSSPSTADCDLAALRIQADGLPTIQLADSRAVRPGQWVMALGHPWGVVGAATGGVIIGMGRQWPEMAPAKRDWLVVSLHMRPGHSGGPLVDVRGRLLGDQHHDQRARRGVCDPIARGRGVPKGDPAQTSRITTTAAAPKLSLRAAAVVMPGRAVCYCLSISSGSSSITSGSSSGISSASSSAIRGSPSPPR